MTYLKDIQTDPVLVRSIFRLPCVRGKNIMSENHYPSVADLRERLADLGDSL
jgi:hypothetical protein